MIHDVVPRATFPLIGHSLGDLAHGLYGLGGACGP